MLYTHFVPYVTILFFHSAVFPIALVKTESGFTVRSAQTGLGR